MKTLRILTLLSLCFCTTAIAQTNDKEYARLEFYGGFATEPDGVPAMLAPSNGFAASYFNKSYKGFEASATFNVSRYVGIKADFVGLYAASRFGGPIVCPPGFICIPIPRPLPDPCQTSLSCPLKSSLYELQGGIQFKDNLLTKRIKPFGHVLAGGARINFRPNPDDPNPPLCPQCTLTGFTATIGGGLDVRLSRHFDLRAVQLDYNPTFFGDRTQHNARLGAGIVVR